MSAFSPKLVHQMVSNKEWDSTCDYLKHRLEVESKQLYRAEGNTLYKLQGKCELLQEMLELRDRTYAREKDNQ